MDKAFAGIGINRDDVYIANIVKCRPPANRVPHDDEAMACLDYLRNQVILVKPKIIVLLGCTALNNILGKDGWYYLKRTRDKETNNFKWELTCREEFESYRRSSRLVKKISEVKNVYIENKIDLDTYTELIRSIEGHSCVLEEKAIYKVSKFYLKQDKELYEEIKSLIYKTYISEEKDFKLNFNK